MIPVTRLSLPAEMLAKRAAAVISNGATPKAARDEWRNAGTAKTRVRDMLKRMAHGVQRCMYCEDSLGTGIDHFQPIAVAPKRAFDWPNHLLACSHCNSNEKRDAYPCDADGGCLLVDPCVDDPAVHLRLLLSSGEYEATGPKGEATIRVFGLNRADLTDGRRIAFARAKAMLRDWHACREREDWADARLTEEALRQSPFANVMFTMERLPNAIAITVVGAATMPSLEAWKRYIERGKELDELVRETEELGLYDDELGER